MSTNSGQDSALWLATSGEEQTCGQIRPAIIMLLIDQQYLHINSSPVIGFENQPVESSILISEESIEQEDSKFQNVHIIRKLSNLIDDIHFSSPGNTPGGLGFNISGSSVKISGNYHDMNGLPRIPDTWQQLRMKTALLDHLPHL
ncbi:hypothetical protein N7470_010414 [Penicillium chermesinum]|nr:hypothetical protein N7470_010414 [Penicillium chermesinum]